MGYLDYAGLQHLWDKLKEKFAPKSHSHDDRYYTEVEMDGKLEKKSSTDHTHDLNDLVNALGVGNSTTLNDSVQIITQDTDTANQKYYRRPLTVLWNYIKSKADSVYSAIGHTHKIQNLEEYTTRVYDATIVRPADTVLASPQDKDGIATFRKLDKNDVGLENVDNTADKNKNVATARGISVGDPVLATGLENSEITGKMNDNKSLGTTATNAGVWGLRNALDFRWYDTHWQIGNLRSDNDQSAGFGFAFKNRGENSFSLKARILTDGTYEGNISGNAATAGTANTLSGFSPRSSQTWGVQTGTFVHGEGDSTGGDFAFRRDCPNAGQVSMVLDGRFYQNEGQYMCLDTNNYSGYALPLSGGTISGALNFANGTWNLVGDDAYMGDHNIGGSFCIMGANDTTRLALVNKDNQGDYALVEYGGGNLNFNKKLGANITGHADGDLSLSGGTMNNGATINFADSGTWTAGNGTYPRDCGGLSWTGQSDGVHLYAEETGGDNLELVVRFTDDNSNGMSFRNATGTTTARITANGTFTGKATSAGYADSAGSVAWGNISGKPNSYPPSSHSHAYLPLGGGTMTGNITFSDIGNTNTSNKISWNGSTDGADIYYQTTAGDQGNLVLNLRDDSNCYLRIAKNGTFKSYFSPDDGNFHGNVNGTADKANSVDWSKIQNKPSSYPPSSHSHNYAGSTSAGGAAISANALNPTVTLTGGDGNVTGYRLIGQVSLYKWSNYRCVMLVNSRHQGAGLVTVTIGNNSSSITQANAYAEIKYWGPTSSGSVISSSSYQVYISSDGKIGYLFWQYYDYSPCVVRVLGSDFTISNGTWMTGIGSGYGKCVATTQINAASTANNATYSTYVKDISNSSNTTFAYSKSGMNYGDYTWLAGWNGYELRAVNKSQFATAGQGVTASGYNYVRFGDGTQMCWGQQDIADTGTTITFAVAFSSIPAVVNSGTEDIDDVFFVHNITTTNFVADKKGWYSGNNTWIAIGRWK